MSDANVIRELTESAQAMGAIAGNEDRFRAVVDAFRAKDGDTFQRLLSEFKILERCERVCHWLRSKECVLLCLELCGPPLEVELPDPREFAQLTAKITADEELVERLANVVEDRDAEGFKALVSELKIERFCHLLCHWVCTVHYRLICEIVCSPARPHRIALVDELTQAGAAIGKLAANEKVFAEAVKAALSSNCDALRGAVEQAGLSGHCRFICEWFCTFRCIRVCLLLCRRFPLERIESPLSEAFEFAQASGRLVAEPAVLERLANAVEASDAEAFQTIVNEHHLGRFCIQLCHWICFFHCQRLCRCVCPPFLPPLFTEVGHFNIIGDIDAATGLTNKLKVGHGGPKFGFEGCLELRGFCPTTSPSFPGVAMRYRFLYEHPAGNKVPLTAGLLCAVDAGTRRIPWPENLAGFAGSNNVLTFQTIIISGAPQPDPTPPVAGAAWFGPAEHVIVPDANGWIAVDPASISGGFTTLVGFDSTTVVPGGNSAPAGLAAGTLVASGDQKLGTDIGIIFEATRVGAPASPPDFTNPLAKIHINNWLEVTLINILQFHTGGGTPCSPLSSALGIEFTADHELMGEWSVGLSTAAEPPPLPGGPVFPGGTSTRGIPPAGAPAQPPPPVAPPPPWRWADTLNYDISQWPTCSYTATLVTRPALTTGLIDRAALPNSVTFCIGGRPPQRVPLGERPPA
jgi:hypothetical protein